jgi:creatinine amidohydrolase/Fe(II)-dependent formamide hydrolase-like protein
VRTPEAPAQEIRERQDRFEMAEYPRPIDARDEVWIQRLTVLEVRDALRAGKTNALIPTGSIEENGPYLTTNKHNDILQVTAESIARRMGDMLIAPIVPMEPGNPETRRMPGTMSLSPETYQGVIRDIATSLRVQGFKNIFLIGDSGGNNRGNEQAAAALNEAWKGLDTRVYAIPEYDDTNALMLYQRTLGVDEYRYGDGFHDNYYVTAQIMAGGDLNQVRLEERIRADKASINGFSLLPVEKSIWHGRQLVEFKTDITVAAMKKALASDTSAQR